MKRIFKFFRPKLKEQFTGPAPTDYNVSGLNSKGRKIQCNIDVDGIISTLEKQSEQDYIVCHLIFLITNC